MEQYPPSERLAIAAEPHAESSGTGRRTLDVQKGNSVALDELGPMIVNSNGVSNTRARPLQP